MDFVCFSILIVVVFPKTGTQYVVHQDEMAPSLGETMWRFSKLHWFDHTEKYYKNEKNRSFPVKQKSKNTRHKDQLSHPFKKHKLIRVVENKRICEMMDTSMPTNNGDGKIGKYQNICR